MKNRFATVCSGIGAPEVAAEPLGWECVFSSDIEAFPNAVRVHHWPHVPNLGDMTKFKEWNYYGIDVLIGGTPCQAFSVAGLRKGLADPRGNLTLTFLGLIDKYRPRWVLWENVPGVLSVDGGKTFGAFLGGLGQLGYGFAYRVLDAQYFGVAQRRRRVFVVGHIGGIWQRAAAVLFERESLRGDPAPSRETGQRVAGTFKACAASGGWSNSAANAAAGYMIETAPTIPARTKGGGGLGTDFDCDGGLISYGLDQEQNGDFELIGTLKSKMNSGGFEGSVFRMTAFGEYSDDGTASAMKRRDYKDATDLVASPKAVRRLTPRECERLQGFPDDFTLIPFRGKPAADGPRYKALGNSMAVPNIRWILQRMDFVDSLK